jgi:hypothetical protein
MDQDSKQEQASRDSNELHDGEPSAAHFREAARLAAARVRASMEERAAEQDTTDGSVAPPDAGTIEEAARTQARAASETMVSEREDPPATKNKKTVSKALKNAQEKAASILPEIDDRLESGARMLRAFEAQIVRLERSARNAEELQAALGPIPDPTGFETAASEFEARFSTALQQAETATEALKATNGASTATSEALAGGLETANTVKTLLETTIRELAEEAERRSSEVKALLASSEDALERMTRQVERAEQVERTICERLDRAEASAARIEQTVAERAALAEDTAEQVGRAADAALGSVREHVAGELAAISAALLNQSNAHQPRHLTTPAPTNETPSAPATREPPLIEVESVTPANPSTNSATGQISHGTLSIDESAIKRRVDAG